MGGVVFAPGGQFTGRFGLPVNFTAGQVVPAGAWFLGVAYTITQNPAPATGTAVEIGCDPGFCISDGVSVVAFAAGQGFPLGD
jgi:hypothetical protein